MVLLSISPQVQSISISLHAWNERCEARRRPHVWNYPGFPYGQQPGPFSACPPKGSPVSLPETALQIGVPFADFCVRYEISLSPIGTNWLYSSKGLAILPWLLWLPKTGRRNSFLLAGRLLFQRTNNSFVTSRMAHGFISSCCRRFMLFLVAYFFPCMFILSWKSLDSINCCYFFLNALIFTWVLLF